MAQEIIFTRICLKQIIMQSQTALQKIRGKFQLVMIAATEETLALFALTTKIANYIKTVVLAILYITIEQSAVSLYSTK